MKRLLITGGSGFVGGHLLSRVRGEWEVFSTFQSHPFSFPGVTTLALDLERGDEVRGLVRRIRPDVIIHCAAWSDLDGCEKSRDRAFRINAEATGIVAETGSALGCRLVYTSTDMVFDGEKGDYDESDQTRPINVYGESLFFFLNLFKFFPNIISVLILEMRSIYLSIKNLQAV